MMFFHLAVALFIFCSCLTSQIQADTTQEININRCQNKNNPSADKCSRGTIPLDPLHFEYERMAFAGTKENPGKISGLNFGKNSRLTAIPFRAFAYNEITRVAVPDGVVEIGGYAFFGNKIKSLEIGVPSFKKDSSRNRYGYDGGRVKIIGKGAFQSNRLELVDIRGIVESISDSAFENNEITSLTLGDRVVTIGARAFDDNKIGSVTFGFDLKTIGDHAFADNQITQIVFGPSLETIESWAFENNKITVIKFPESVLEIGEGAFAGNPNIFACFEGKVQPSPDKDPSYFGFDSFPKCDEAGLGAYIPCRPEDFARGVHRCIRGNILINSSLTEIEDGAFVSKENWERGRITGVDFSGCSGLTSIGAQAFEGNVITKVTIPNSVRTISGLAFQFNNLNSVTIGTNVELIGMYAFHHNQIDMVILPDNVKTIGDFAFDDNKIRSVTIGKKSEINWYKCF